MATGETPRTAQTRPVGDGGDTHQVAARAQDAPGPAPDATGPGGEDTRPGRGSSWVDDLPAAATPRGPGDPGRAVGRVRDRPPDRPAAAALDRNAGHQLHPAGGRGQGPRRRPRRRPARRRRPGPRRRCVLRWRTRGTSGSPTRPGSPAAGSPACSPNGNGGRAGGPATSSWPSPRAPTSSPSASGYPPTVCAPPDRSAPPPRAPSGPPATVRDPARPDPRRTVTL